MARGSGATYSEEIEAGVLIARGERALRAVAEGRYRSGVFVMLGPVSEAFLFYEDMLREVYSRYGYSIVVPSSYDDVAVYVNMRRQGFRICRGSASYKDIEIHCLERGEKPWPRILLGNEESLSILFSEDLDPVDLRAGNPGAPGHAGRNIIYISYGVLQPSGVLLDRWASVRINPFEDILVLIGRDKRSLAMDFVSRGHKISIELR